MSTKKYRPKDDALRRHPLTAAKWRLELVSDDPATRVRVYEAIPPRSDPTRTDEGVRCPSADCGGRGLIHQERLTKSTYLDKPRDSRFIHLIVLRRQLQCTSCGQLFTETPPGIDSKLQMTTDLLEAVRIKLESFETFQAIAKEFWLSASYVAKIDKTIIQREDYRRFETRDRLLPVHIGIHNTRIGKTDCALLTDPNHGRVLEVALSREPSEIATRFERWFDRDQFAQVGLVSIPMKARYRDLVRSLFPDARILVPKDYLENLANEIMNSVVTKVGHYMARNREGRDMTWEIVCKRARKLTPTQRRQLEKLLSGSDLLRTAYEQKQLFLQLLVYQLPERAMQAHGEWSESVPAALRTDFAPLIDEVRHWRTEVFSAFQWNFKHYLADLDRMVDKLNRRGRNYSLETIRGRLLYTHKFQEIDAITPHVPGTEYFSLETAGAKPAPPPKDNAELGSSDQRILQFLDSLP
jgi:transposase